jgi:hypothetical protein
MFHMGDETYIGDFTERHRESIQYEESLIDEMDSGKQGTGGLLERFSIQFS